MEGRYVALLVVVFLLGFTINEITAVSIASVEVEEKASPHDWVKQRTIRLNNERMSVATIEGYENYVANFTDTNSMDPVLDEFTNAIELVPRSEEDIHIGDIISYRSKEAKGVVIHRVRNIGHDDNGWFAETRGDNLEDNDPQKVRFGQITGIVWAILY